MANLIPEESTRLANPDDFNSQMREYVKLKASLTVLEARQKELRDKLFENIVSEGIEDSNGSWVYELPDPIDGVVKFEKQRRTTRKLDELAADQIITSKKLEQVAYKTIQVIDEEAVYSLLYDGTLTEEDIDTMFPITETWALMTKKK
jgi:translation initiation factor IF-2